MSRLSLALEDAEIADDAVVADGTDLSVAEATVEAQAGAAEVTEATSDVETFDSAVAEASDDTATIEQVAETVADSLDEEGPTGGEGMDPVAATLATETIERIRRKYRISSGVRSAPALESFKPRASRKEMTRLALESFSDTLKKMWERIKAFFRGLWDKIKSAVKSIFQSNIKTEKRAIELKKKIQGWNFTATPTKSSIDSGSFSSAFTIDGKLEKANIAKILENQIKLSGSSESINKETLDLTDGIRKVTLAVIETTGAKQVDAALTTSIEVVSKAAEKVADQIGNLLGTKIASPSTDLTKDLVGSNQEDFTKGSSVTVYGPYYGGKYIVIAKLKQKKEAGATGPEEFAIKTEFRSLGKEGGKSIEVGGKNELSSLCDKAMEVAKAVAGAERAVKVGDKAATDLFKVIDDVIAHANKANDMNKPGSKDSMHALTYVRETTSSVIKLISNNNSVFLSNSLSAANTALDYVDASMKQYKQ